MWFPFPLSADDYIPQSTSLTFLPGTNRACFNIDIIDDNQLEDNEQFSVQISSNDRVDIGMGSSIVTITNDDSKKTQ